VWAIKKHGWKKVYLFGSDYIWPRTTNKIARKAVEQMGGEVVGEEYLPLGHTQFGSLINKIKLKKPDVILSTLVGGSNVAYYKQATASGLTGTKQPTIALAVTEEETSGIGAENIVGVYSVMGYLQLLDNPVNKQFVADFKPTTARNAPSGTPWRPRTSRRSSGRWPSKRPAASTSKRLSPPRPAWECPIVGLPNANEKLGGEERATKEEELEMQPA
jgi:ABC-type branched-subunit amino acid transport system substrate-binding protein